MSSSPGHDAGGGAPRRPNRLADSTSPYLLQHAYNPVDWRPWGAEAIEAARRDDKPILLSVGYAACHWCHVMERESFEDPEIAALMNEHFICIKVDREERPDVDEIYMGAVQLLTGAGGWPMTVFLTPDLEPFWGGTYFPPDDRWGRPGMRQIVPAVARIFREQRAEVTAQAAEITRAVRGLTSGSGATAPGDGGPGAAVLDTAVARLLQNHDDEWGGFGPAPKFPPGMAISLLLRVNARAPRRGVVEAVRTTLARMALGGMFDHLGGGFARYSTDEKWHVPHFEKMLYDNALLVSAYAEALRAIGDDDGLYRRTIEETLDFVQRELTDPAGGFYSSLDADSEGEEGRYYVWTPDQLAAVLGPDDAEFLGALYDVTPQGNWEHGNSILWRTRPLTADERLRAAPLRGRLLEARGARVRPGLDDKVLACWNGLMISAFVHAATTLDRPQWLEPAVAAADFVLRELRRDGRLLRSWRQGRADHNAFLEDHAAMVLALADLYQATFEPRWRRSAGELLEQAVALYGDRAGGFFFTSHDHEELITRPKNAHDGATPAGNSLMAEALLTMSAIEERDDWRALAEQTVLAFGRSLNEIPSAHHRLLRTVDGLVNGTVEIVLAGAAADGPLARAARSRYLPNVVITAGREMVDGRPAAYVCRNRVCGLPITAPEALAAELSGTTAPRS